jgi:hypothetical protein
MDGHSTCLAARPRGSGVVAPPQTGLWGVQRIHRGRARGVGAGGQLEARVAGWEAGT